MQIGLGFLGEILTVNEKVEYARHAENLGLKSIWLAEHYYHRDAMIAAAAILSKTVKVTVGTSVINPYTRNPALIAMSAATLDEMSDGMFILGIGTGFPQWIEEQMDIPVGNLGRSLVESLEIIRNILHRKETSFEGRRFVMRNVSLGFDSSSSRIPIYVAAVGPRMLEMAGRIADGVILSGGKSSPSYLRWSMKAIRRGLSSGREKEFAKVCLVFTSLARSKAKARTMVKPSLLMPLMRPGRAKLVLGDESLIKDARDAFDAGDRKHALERLPDDVVDTLSISGNAEECMRGIRKFADLGLTDLVLEPVHFESDELMKLLRMVAK